MSVTLPAIEPWPLAAILTSALAPNAWAVLAAPKARVETEAADLGEQLKSLSGAPVEILSIASAGALLETAAKYPTSILVLHGLERLSVSEWAQVDGGRSRLEGREGAKREQPAVMVLAEDSLPTLRIHAPNLWSWLAGAVWRGVPEAGMSDEQRVQRLAALREHFGFDDAELLRLFKAGELPPDPHIPEWLVLIGKGSLLER